MKLRLLGVVVGAGAMGLIASACGSNDDSTFNPNDAGDEFDPFGGQHNGDGGFDFDAFGDVHLDPDAFWATDPPPQWCGPDGGAPAPVPPGGTPECPDDKNREGCPCPTRGATAACWPGLRKNRNIGICKDGVTTCNGTGEFDKAWGPCVGYVPPDPTAKMGKAACGCFSVGQWKIENLVPYFITYYDQNKVETATYAISTYQGDGGGWQPPQQTFTPPTPPSLPTDPWSRDTLTVDCAGTFTLYYELKAGDFANPKPTDCSLAKVKVGPFDYPKENVVQQLPVVGPWVDADPNKTACADAFHNVGGYGEMSVVGLSVLCDKIDDGSGNAFVFNRIKYCKETDPNCGQDGSGTFH
jgi:hypothetical protein